MEISRQFACTQQRWMVHSAQVCNTMVLLPLPMRLGCQVVLLLSQHKPVYNPKPTCLGQSTSRLNGSLRLRMDLFLTSQLKVALSLTIGQCSSFRTWKTQMENIQTTIALPLKLQTLQRTCSRKQWVQAAQSQLAIQRDKISRCKVPCLAYLRSPLLLQRSSLLSYGSDLDR